MYNSQENMTKNYVRVSMDHVRQSKKEKRKISMITCYDSSFVPMIDASAIDLVLVGDSMGNVVLGYDSTLPVTMEDMIHHTAAVTRKNRRALVVADMPFLSYHLSEEQALSNAGKLVQQAGAHAVKLEGGTSVAGAVKRIVSAGIPVVGHLGLTPQSVLQMGGYKLQGKSTSQAELLKKEAALLVECGISALVLEMVPESLAKEVTESLAIPTIGIGAGRYCDGQVLVLHDMLGFHADFRPRFLKTYANLGESISEALTTFDKEVKLGHFPGPEHTY